MKKIKFSEIYHQETKGEPDGIFRGKWHNFNCGDTTEYKIYPRLPKIIFADEKKAEVGRDLFCGNNHEGSEVKPEIDQKMLSSVLRYSCGMTNFFEMGKKERSYPSSGNCYPIETYFIINSSLGELGRGVYHYNVKDHSADVLVKERFFNEENQKKIQEKILIEAPVVVLLTAVFDRTQVKFGERGYRVVLRESGHIGQNIFLMCKRFGWNCSFLDFNLNNDTLLEKIIDIDGVSESVVSVIAIGFKK